MKMHKTPLSQKETCPCRFANGERITLEKGESGLPEARVRELRSCSPRGLPNLPPERR